MLDEDARVLDVIAQLQYEASREKGADLERVRHGQMSATFLFKAEFYGRVNPSDPEALAYVFEQSIHDVIHSSCLLPLSAALDLGMFVVAVTMAENHSFSVRVINTILTNSFCCCRSSFDFCEGSIQAYEEAAQRGVPVSDLRIDAMLFRYLPSRLLQKVPTADRPNLAKAITRRAGELQRKQYTVVAAHVAYLEYLSKMPWYVLM